MAFGSLFQNGAVRTAAMAGFAALSIGTAAIATAEPAAAFGRGYGGGFGGGNAFYRPRFGYGGYGGGFHRGYGYGGYGYGLGGLGLGLALGGAYGAYGYPYGGAYYGGYNGCLRRVYGPYGSRLVNVCY